MGRSSALSPLGATSRCGGAQYGNAGEARFSALTPPRTPPHADMHTRTLTFINSLILDQNRKNVSNQGVIAAPGSTGRQFIKETRIGKQI